MVPKTVSLEPLRRGQSEVFDFGVHVGRGVINHAVTIGRGVVVPYATYIRYAFRVAPFFFVTEACAQRAPRPAAGTSEEALDRIAFCHCYRHSRKSTRLSCSRRMCNTLTLLHSAHTPPVSFESPIVLAPLAPVFHVCNTLFSEPHTNPRPLTHPPLRYTAVDPPTPTAGLASVHPCATLLLFFCRKQLLYRQESVGVPLQPEALDGTTTSGGRHQ